MVKEVTLKLNNELTKELEELCLKYNLKLSAVCMLKLQGFDFNNQKQSK